MFHKNIAILALVISFGCFLSKAEAESIVIKKNALKSNNYGVTYSLPKTVLTAEVAYSKISTKAGPYAKYAAEYLRITDNIIYEDGEYFALDRVEIVPKGVPNKEETYLVEFKAKSNASFVYLTGDGLICSINTDPEVESVDKPDKPVASQPSADPLKVSAQSAFTEEYLRAGSVSKMAETVAKQIYKLRESRLDILTGDADNAPRDGEAMKIVLQELEAREKALVELFTGTRSSEKMTAAFEIEPTGDMENQILFRFSKHYGITTSDDLGGSPVYINVKKVDTEPVVPVDTKQAATKLKAETKAIVYNVPGKAFVEVNFGTQSLYKGEIQIVQFGTVQTLATALFDDKKAPIKVTFYPNTGAIRQITQ
ncbi:MAG: DUF4831 family protein [Dysgonamonadaceae bacterium]|jgi:hypothetical protein|nr:DUF4831 family protein [Dysgonamonadaceae bacterium]